MATAWFVVRLLAVTAGFAALHYYLWWRLCRDTTRPGSRWRPIGAAVLALLAVFGLLARFFVPSGAPMPFQSAVGWPGLIWFGIFLYLFGLLVVGEVVRWYLIRRFRRGMSEAEREADRADGFYTHLRSLWNRLLQRFGTGPMPASAKTPSSDPAQARTAASPPAKARTSDAALTPAAAPEQTRSSAPASEQTRSPAANSAQAATPTEDSDPPTAGPTTGSPAADVAAAQPPATDPPAAGHAPGPPADDPAARPPASGSTRRLVMSRAIGIGAAAITFATVGHGLYEGYRTPPLKAVTVRLPRLDRRFDGYRIAVVGDTHFSAIRGRGYCERVVDQINRAQADLIAFVGDLASSEADQIRDATDPLAGLRARDGTFFVAGNAEHYVGADEWYDRVAELGMTGLPNTRVELPGFDLAGVNDLIVEQRGIEGETGPDFEAALGDRDPARPVVFMAHQPNAVDRALEFGIDLQLSGHTHGGQMWPVHYASLLRSGQLSGLERHGDAQVYVTNGAGTNGPPIRVGADADITVLTLRA